MQRIHLFVLIISTIFAGCNANQDKGRLATVQPFQQGPADSAYMQAKPAVQVFTVNMERATVLKAKGGTELLVPAGSLVDGHGRKVTGNVQLEVVEAFTLQDFMSAGLATVSGNRLLLSEGMLYINAKAGGQQLAIDSAAPLRVSMPLMKGRAGFEMFRADSTGWVADSTMSAPAHNFPVPLNLLYPEGNKFFFHCIEDYGGKNQRYHYMDTNVVTVTDPRFENTNIATYEFKRRGNWLIQLSIAMSYLVNRENLLRFEQCKNQRLNYELYREYFEHPRRPFRITDSIVKQRYIAYFKANKEKIRQLMDEVNVAAKNYFFQWTDTHYYFDFRKTSFEQFYMLKLKDNSMGEGNNDTIDLENTQETIFLDDYGVNLDAADAFEQLQRKNLSVAVINEVLTAHFNRKSFMRLLQQQQEIASNRGKVTGLYESTVFSVSQMGWINCDIFFDDPKAAPANIMVNNTGTEKLDFMDCSLVIPDMNVRLSAFMEKPGSYSFTRQGGRLIKLPIGQPAVIVGVSMQNGALYFASQKIVIKDGLNIGLPMAKIADGGLKDALAGALR